ncbi:MAG: DUF423 domain-containing protein [bacterium]
MNKKLLLSGAILGVISVILGAFAAHALKEQLSSDSLASFNTGVRYQMYHALFLLALANSAILSEKAKKSLLILTLLGVVLFSGSIYLLSTEAMHAIDFSSIGFITPVGGLFLIIAWVLLIFHVLKSKSE